MGRRVGIVGRGLLDLEAASWLGATAPGELDAEGAVELWSTLWPGAPQILANIAVAKALGLTAVMAGEQLGKAIADKHARKDHFRLLTLAREVVRLPPGTSDELALLEADKTIVRRCDVVFAVWDGAPSRAPGDVAASIAFIREYGRRMVLFDPKAKSITHSRPRPALVVPPPATWDPIPLAPKPVEEEPGARPARPAPSKPTQAPSGDQEWEEM